jgi:hypothetical protein
MSLNIDRVGVGNFVSDSALSTSGPISDPASFFACVCKKIFQFT